MHLVWELKLLAQSTLSRISTLNALGKLAKVLQDRGETWKQSTALVLSAVLNIRLTGINAGHRNESIPSVIVDIGGRKILSAFSNGR
jgi:hypothetical protein